MKAWFDLKVAPVRYAIDPVSNTPNVSGGCGFWTHLLKIRVYVLPFEDWWCWDAVKGKSSM